MKQTNKKSEGIKPTLEEVKLEMEWINSMISTSIDYDDLRNIANELVVSRKQLIQEKDTEFNNKLEQLKKEIRKRFIDFRDSDVDITDLEIEVYSIIEELKEK